MTNLKITNFLFMTVQEILDNIRILAPMVDDKSSLELARFIIQIERDTMDSTWEKVRKIYTTV